MRWYHVLRCAYTFSALIALQAHALPWYQGRDDDMISSFNNQQYGDYDPKIKAADYSLSPPRRKHRKSSKNKRSSNRSRDYLHGLRTKKRNRRKNSIRKIIKSIEKNSHSASADYYDQTNKERRRRLKDSYKASWRGLSSAPADVVKAVTTIVTNPVESAKGFYNMARHPVKTGKAMNEDAKRTCRDEAYCVGKVTGIAALTAATAALFSGGSAGAEATKAAKVSTAANVAANSLDDLGNAAKVAAAASSAADEVSTAAQIGRTASMASTAAADDAAAAAASGGMLGKAGLAGKDFMIGKVTDLIKDPKMHTLLIDRVANVGKHGADVAQKGGQYGAANAGRTGLIGGEIGANTDRASTAYASHMARQKRVFEEIRSSSLPETKKQFLYQRLYELENPNR